MSVVFINVLVVRVIFASLITEWSSASNHKEKKDTQRKNIHTMTLVRFPCPDLWRHVLPSPFTGCQVTVKPSFSRGCETEVCQLNVVVFV
jgi:hypothetical protein